MKTRRGDYDNEMPDTKFVMSHEPTIQRFSGTREPREVQCFLEELEDLLEQRQDLTDAAKSRKTWSLLARQVQVELRTQGLGPDKPVKEIKDALLDTYGDKRSVAQLSPQFYNCRQEGYEDIRHFSQRLHEIFRALVDAQKAEKTQALDDKQLRARLVDGIASPNIRQGLRQHLTFNGEATFLAMRKKALEIEADFIDGPSQAVQAVRAETSSEEVNSVSPTMAELMAKLDARATELAEVKTTLAEMKAAQADLQKPRSETQSDKGQVCRHCQSGNAYRRL